ncbi:uncharacterized protein LOC121060865 isoform X2 [Cygnus olor]|uniref:uncharacterized protein LOC121060865 isoform X2 n=1 Tax=Cygnus olor TaxID=8869 RepID=UPI001ADE6B2F|nr:uncharacterized protein LOC121060865 isoform X2 [Cygnus olor]
MGASGAGWRWLCVAVLGAGAVLALEGEELWDQNITQHDDNPEAMGDPTAATRDVDGMKTWPVASPTPSLTRDPPTITAPTQAGSLGNQTQNGSGVPVKYWSPVIFVLLALLVLFFTYRRTKGEGTRDPTTSISDFSDALVLEHDTALILPAAQEDRKGAEKPQAQELTETTFCQPDPPPGQPLPSQPAVPEATGGARCSGEPGAD